LPFGTLLHGVTTRSKRNVTAMVTAPVLSHDYAENIGLRSVGWQDEYKVLPWHEEGDDALKDKTTVQAFKPRLKVPLTEPLDCRVLFSDENGVRRYVHVVSRFHWKSHTYESAGLSLEHLLSHHLILSEHASVEFVPEEYWQLEPSLDHLRGISYK